MKEKLCSSGFIYLASSYAQAVESFGHVTRNLVHSVSADEVLKVTVVANERIVWTREKHSLFHIEDVSEDSPITRWCPTSDRLKGLCCLCNSVFWKTNSTLSPSCLMRR